MVSTADVPVPGAGAGIDEGAYTPLGLAAERGEVVHEDAGEQRHAGRILGAAVVVGV
jgi:hypothetical protein